MARLEKKFKPNYVLTTNVCCIVNSVTVVKSRPGWKAFWQIVIPTAEKLGNISARLELLVYYKLPEKSSSRVLRLLCLQVYGFHQKVGSSGHCVFSRTVFTSARPVSKKQIGFVYNLLSALCHTRHKIKSKLSAMRILVGFDYYACKIKY